MFAGTANISILKACGKDIIRKLSSSRFTLIINNKNPENFLSCRGTVGAHGCGVAQRGPAFCVLGIETVGNGVVTAFLGVTDIFNDTSTTTYKNWLQTVQPTDATHNWCVDFWEGPVPSSGHYALHDAYFAGRHPPVQQKSSFLHCVVR
jgi:hypothetical protein